MSGFSRDDVEPGLKDIVHALFLVLKRGSFVSLLFTDMGRLVFQNHGQSQPSVQQEIAQNSLQTSESPASEKINEFSSEKNSPKQVAIAEISEIEKQKVSKISEKREEIVSKTSEKQDEIDEIERLAILLTTRGETHTHSHAGNRLWSDAKCPICRQQNTTVVEVKDILTAREKKQDKMLLLLSLEVDREHLRCSKEEDVKKIKTAVNTAQYNHLEATDKESKRKVEQRNLPLGNIFENRDPGPDRVLQAKELKAGLYDQMTIRRCKKTRDKAAKAEEDRERNERLLKEFKTAQVQNHFDKLRRRQQQQEALGEQMITQELARKREAILEPMTENSFARSETLMFLYQKEKAKQLYQEQLAILKQRRDYEKHVADMEKHHSLERLTSSRKELEKDIHAVKQSNYLMRKGLENTWAVQQTQQKQAQAALGY
ncbi:hypothetical protein HK100_005488 [Physocladia obscura]|uniref:CCDC81 HU domain-containing protein n=1 Tax=Physocladia obscura TaxID=109957 RepID=A0AAD5X827_9FUNG|nr:hypothetical protein HK100_005488 [Physocladia obscura]